MPYPTLATSAGTMLYVSAALPATHDEAGFTALTLTEVGFLTTPGGFPREMREFGEKNLMNGKKFYFPTVSSMETLSPTVIFQDDDAGQDIIETSSDGNTLLAFVYRLPSGMRVGVVGYVTGYAPVANDPTEPVEASFSIRPVFADDGTGTARYTPA